MTLPPPVPHTALLMSVLLACGCATNDGRLAMENQLRSQEDTIRRLSKQVDETSQQLIDQDRELAATRKSGANVPGFTSVSRAGSAPPEVDVAWGSVTSLAIHQLTSGIMKRDGQVPVLTLVLQPLDDQRELVKVAGRLSIKVSSVRSETDAAQTEISSKTFSITESRSLWSRGLVSSGFHIMLPLTADVVPVDGEESKILVAAELDLGSARKYSDSQLIPIR